LLLLAAWLGFGIRNAGSYLVFTILVVFGTATFIAMGFALSSFASTVESTVRSPNLAFFPMMMLLSGVYFRLDGAPQWLQKAVLILSALTRSSAPSAPSTTTAPRCEDHASGLMILAAWAVLSFVFAVYLKRFRWV